MLSNWRRPIGTIKLQPTNYNLCFILSWMCWQNTLNQKFQYNFVDVLAIGSTLDWLISILNWHFLCGHRPKFGRSTENFGSFLSQAWVDGVLRWRANNTNNEFVQIITVYEAWTIWHGINEWYTNRPHLMKLWQKRNFIPCKHCNLWNRTFKMKCYQESLASSNEVGQTLDALMWETLCMIEVENMDGRTIFVLCGNMNNQRVLSLDWSIVKSSNFSTLTFEKIWFDLHFCPKIKDFLNPSLKGWFLMLSIILKGQKRKEKKVVRQIEPPVAVPLAMLGLTRCLSLCQAV